MEAEVTIATGSELLTPAATAELLGISRYRLQLITAAGELPFIALGPHTKRYKRADVERFIADRLVMVSP
jgi:excisionase family DNA binding protein